VMEPELEELPVCELVLLVLELLEEDRVLELEYGMLLCEEVDPVELPVLERGRLELDVLRLVLLLVGGKLWALDEDVLDEVDERE